MFCLEVNKCGAAVTNGTAVIRYVMRLDRLLLQNSHGNNFLFWINIFFFLAINFFAFLKNHNLSTK